MRKQKKETCDCTVIVNYFSVIFKYCCILFVVDLEHVTLLQEKFPSEQISRLVKNKNNRMSS